MLWSCSIVWTVLLVWHLSKNNKPFISHTQLMTFYNNYVRNKFIPWRNWSSTNNNQKRIQEWQTDVLIVHIHVVFIVDIPSLYFDLICLQQVIYNNYSHLISACPMCNGAGYRIPQPNLTFHCVCFSFHEYSVQVYSHFIFALSGEY